MCPLESAIGFLDCMCDLDNFMKDIGGLFRGHTFEAQDALSKWTLLLRDVTARECKIELNLSTVRNITQRGRCKLIVLTFMSTVFEILCLI